VYLADVWPSEEEVQEVVDRVLDRDLYLQEYGEVYTGNQTWNKVKVSETRRYPWQPDSTYIRKPPFFDTPSPGLQDISDARVLALLGDTVTTDHISPAGGIPQDSPAGRWLMEQGVSVEEFNSYGSRRGNHEVMMRGTFANVRIKNLLAPGTEGGVTTLLPDGKVLPIYDAAVVYARRQVPLVVIAGREYGTGSSRDWAAKGTALLGVRAVLAASFERIHRSNLIGMGVLPLQFAPDQDARSLGLTGKERFSIDRPSRPGGRMQVRAKADGGKETSFEVLVRLDTTVEMEYYRNGGILQTVLEQMTGG
jgi:aconitate hydratase